MKKLFLVSCLVLIVFVSSCVIYLDTFEPVLESLWSSKWIGSIGEAGTGDGQFQLTFDLTKDSQGNIYITDSEGCRVQKFDSSGNFIMTWGSLGPGND